MAQNQQWKNGTSKFLQASYPVRSKSVTECSKCGSEVVALQRNNSAGQLSNSNPNLSLLNSNVKRIQIKKQDHTIRNLMVFVFAILIAVFCLDVHAEIGKEQHKNEVEAKHCFEEYKANECDDAVEVMKEKCMQLKLCFSTPAHSKLIVVELVSRMIGRMVKNCTSSAGLLGTIFLFSLICATFFFAYKSSKATMIIQRH